MATDEEIRATCDHAWEVSGRWGVIVGLSRCTRCGTLSRKADFKTPPRSQAEGPAKETQ
jgi:hypothetical protein